MQNVLNFEVWLIMNICGESSRAVHLQTNFYVNVAVEIFIAKFSGRSVWCIITACRNFSAALSYACSHDVRSLVGMCLEDVFLLFGM